MKSDPPYFKFESLWALYDDLRLTDKIRYIDKIRKKSTMYVLLKSDGY